MSSVKREIELYDGMCHWLKNYLNDKYKNKRCNIIVVDCHSVTLDTVLEKYEIIRYYPQVVGLNIEIDVLGMVIWEKKAEIYFIELEARLEERLKRNFTENRLKNKYTKQDTEKSKKLLLEAEDKHRNNSYYGEIKEKNYCRINNTNISAKEVAKIIKEKFNL